MCTWNFSFSANKHRHNNNRPFGDRAPTSYKYGNTQCQLYLQLVPPRPFSTFVLFLIVFFSGDSYTQTGFNVTSGPLPSVGDPMGNPPYPVMCSALYDDFNLNIVYRDILPLEVRTGLTSSLSSSTGRPS